jgi:hypothetical protein
VEEKKIIKTKTKTTTEKVGQDLTNLSTHTLHFSHLCLFSSSLTFSPCTSKGLRATANPGGGLAHSALFISFILFPNVRWDTLLDVALAKPGGPGTAVSNSGSQSGAFRSTIVVVLQAY